MRRGMLLVVISILATGLCVAAQAAEDRYGDSLPEGAIQRLGTLRMRYTTYEFEYLPGDRAAIATSNGVDIWDLAQGKLLESQQVSPSTIKTLRVRSDGNALLVTNTAGQVIEWSLAEKRALHQIETGQANLTFAVYSPDSRYVLSVDSRPPTYKYWELSTGRLVSEITEDLPNALVSTALVAPDGRSMFASSGSGGEIVLRQYDLATGQQIAEIFKSESINELDLSDDGRYLVAATRYHAHEFEVQSRQEIRSFRGHPGYSVTSVAYGPEPGQLLTGANDGTIRLWDRETTSVVRLWRPHSARVSRVRVSADGQRVLSFGSGMLMETVIATGEPRLRWGRHLAPVLAVAFAADGRSVVTGSSDGTMWLWDARSGEGLQMMTGADSGVYSLAVSPDGARAAAGDREGVVREWDLKGGALRRKIPGHRAYVRAMAYSPNSEYMASSADDGSVLLRYGGAEQQEFDMIAAFRGHRGGVLAVAFSPDSKRMLSGGRDRTIRLWDPAVTWAGQMQVFQEHRDWVQAVAYVGDGSRALSADRSGMILHWDLPADKVIARMNHGAGVNALACSPDGSRAYSAGADGRIVCWDLATGLQIAAFTGPGGPVNALALSPDGTLLVSGFNDATALVWQTPQ